MKLSQFRFEIPSELIAQHPTDDRADSRMMVINRAEGTIEHHHFRDILV